MLEGKVAKPYAEALYQIGLGLYFKQPNSQEFYNMLFHIQDFIKLLGETPTLKEYLDNPFTSNKNKKVILKKCLSKDIHPNTLNFLFLLVDKKRINCIESICEEFLEKSNNFFSIKYIDVTSVIELTQEQEKALSEKLATMFTPFYKERPIIRLKLKIDKSILGGIILRSASKVSDLSVRGELKGLGKKLGVSL